MGQRNIVDRCIINASAEESQYSRDWQRPTRTLQEPAKLVTHRANIDADAKLPSDDDTTISELGILNRGMSLYFELHTAGTFHCGSMWIRW